MDQEQQTLSRDLSLFDVTMIGVGAMIGAGIFVLTGDAAGVAGPALVMSFALNGVVTIFTAMVYAELGSAIPEAGGGYLWIKEGLPGANAFLAGWMSWFAHAVAGALYALGFGAFLFALLERFGVPLTASGLSLGLARKIFGVGIALFFAYINFRGSSETGTAGNIVTLAKVAVIGLFCAFGIKFMFFPDLGFRLGAAQGGMGIRQLQPFIPPETGWSGILSAMGLTFIAFEGYEIIVQAGEEVVQPRRNIPKAVFWSLAIVIPIYLIVAFVLVGASNSGLLLQTLHSAGQPVPEGLSAATPNWKILRYLGELGLSRAAGQFIPYGDVLVLMGGILSTMSALNATTFSSTRVAFAMGRDKNLPDAFGRISEHKRTPHVALFWTAVLICFMVAFVPLTTVAAAGDIMFLLLFLQVNVAVITLRKKYGDKLAYGYLMPFYPVVPIIGVAGELVLALFMFVRYPIGWAYVLAWLAVGFLFYSLYARKRERAKTAPPVVIEERPLQVRPNCVLIPVADPESARTHVALGAKIARARNSELVLLHVIRVPGALPPKAAGRFVEQARPGLAQLRSFAESFEVPVRSLIRVGHQPATAIVHTAEDYHGEYLLMGWRGQRRHAKTLIGSNIDRVLKDSNCHAIIMQRSDGGMPRRILVPVSNPKAAPLAVGVASLLLDASQPGRITVLHLGREALSEEAKEAFIAQIRAGVAGPETEGLFGEGSPVSFEFARHGGDVVRAIVQRSEGFDRMVLGTTVEGLLQRKVFGRIPIQIARQARCPVVFVRPRAQGVQFEIQQFFQFFRDLEVEGEGEEGGADAG